MAQKKEDEWPDVEPAQGTRTPGSAEGERDPADQSDGRAWSPEQESVDNERDDASKD